MSARHLDHSIDLGIAEFNSICILLVESAMLGSAPRAANNDDSSVCEHPDIGLASVRLSVW
jgi:hypothetical protein